MTAEKLFEHQGAILPAQSDGCAVWQFRNETGDGTMTTYEIFSGVMLAFNDFHMERYRMQNSPESKAENPFTDVKADAYYANAVLWAVENGVTTGASATTFDPRGRLHARSDRHFPLSLPEQVSDKSKQESPRRNPSGAFFAERVGEISTEVDVALRKSSSACGKNIKSDVVSSGGDARR